MFSILEQYAHFVSVRPCIFNFLRSPEFMQRYTRSVVHDERVCEKLSVIVERVCMMRRKLPHALLQFVFITGRYLVHENRLCSFRFARIFHSNFRERRKLKEWRINVERNYLIRKRSEINAWNAISQHESGGSALNTLVTHDRVASSFEVTFKFIYCYRSIKKSIGRNDERTYDFLY